jgi:capsular exopolysaccharide synthesis family protein
VNLQEGDAQITSYADPPTSPVAPDKKLAVALGGIAGGFAGMGLVFLRVVTDKQVRSKSQLAKLVRGATVITLPRARRFRVVPADPLSQSARDPFGPLAESIRSLRSHLMLSMAKEAGQVVAFVSARPDSGKTSASLLLARSVAQMGVSCVVVDTDLRRAAVAGRCGLATRPDLVDVLQGTLPLEQALHDDPDSAAQILTARSGLGDPAGVLLSEAMANLIKDLRQRFRVVIIDTAPLGPVSDAAPIVRMADNVVLMVRYGTLDQDVQAGFDRLLNLGVKQISAVLSMAPRRTEETYSYAPNA